MRRWLVILSLAMAQCPDIAEASSPPSLGAPLPKPRPVLAPVNDPPTIPDVQVRLSPERGASAMAPAPTFRDADGGCNGGRRIISAYYAEGVHTASGERFDPRGLTAAHRTLPFGTRLTVSNPRTGKSVTVVINDRGPFVTGVTLDLSLGAAQAIGLRGTGAVCIQ